MGLISESLAMVHRDVDADDVSISPSRRTIIFSLEPSKVNLVDQPSKAGVYFSSVPHFHQSSNIYPWFFSVSAAVLTSLSRFFLPIPGRYRI